MINSGKQPSSQSQNKIDSREKFMIFSPREEDLKFIAEGFENTIALWEEYQVTQEKVAKRMEFLRKWGEDENIHLTVVLDKNNQCRGFNSVHCIRDYNNNPMGKIIILYIQPEYRKMGLAKLLKEEGEEWLRQKGATAVLTEIDAANQRMLEIIPQAGFVKKSTTFIKQL
jgi:GNAT superfamily N-acetyltransferase